MISGSNVKNGRRNVPVSFWKRNQNVLESFPNLSCWEQIVLIWTRICSPELNRKVIFRWADLGKNSDVLVSFPVRCRNVCGTFVERLLLYCLTLLISGIICNQSLSQIQRESKRETQRSFDQLTYLSEFRSHFQLYIVLSVWKKFLTNMFT